MESRDWPTYWTRDLRDCWARSAGGVGDFGSQELPFWGQTVFGRRSFVCFHYWLSLGLPRKSTSTNHRIKSQESVKSRTENEALVLSRMSKEHPAFPFNSPMHLITLFGWSSYPWSYHKTQEISVAPRKGLDLRSYAPWFSPWWSVCETRVLINTVHCLPQA